LESIYLSRQSGVVWRQIDEYAVLLKVETGDYCEINEIGLFVWQQLEQETAADELIRKVTVAFDANEQAVAEDVMEFARGLQKLDMLVIADRRRPD
jgi:hypothetical protein